MAVELAFWHANNGTAKCPITRYRKSNDGGVSLPTHQRQFISVHTYLLQKVQ